MVRQRLIGLGAALVMTVGLGLGTAVAQEPQEPCSYNFAFTMRPFILCTGVVHNGMCIGRLDPRSGYLLGMSAGRSTFEGVSLVNLITGQSEDDCDLMVMGSREDPVCIVSCP
jgi:hypothetical protein